MEMSREVNNVRSVIPVKTGIQEVKEENWIPAGVYPDENRDRNDDTKNFGRETEQ